MSNKLRFATIGTSHIAELYVKGALDTGKWNLTAVYSRKFETGKAFADKFGCEKVFTSLEEMAKSDETDAVYIASPNKFHFEQSKLFLENGKHVICEKPLCSHLDDAKILFDIAEKNKLVLTEAMLYMHVPAREILKHGLEECGNVRNAFLNFSRKSKQLNRLLQGELPNIFNPKMEAGGLMDLGVYCIYPAVDLFGKPEKAEISAYKLETGADGCGSVIFHYPDKCVNLSYSKISDSFLPSEFQGEEKTITIGSVGLLSDIKLVSHDGKSEMLYEEEEKYKLMGYEAEDFYDFIDGKNTEFYQYCREMSLTVSEILERLRNKAEIAFPSDAQR